MNKIDLTSIDAIVFDLGGVLINLDYTLTTKAFKHLGIEHFSTLYSQAQQSGLFDEFEKGKCSIPYFVNHLLDYLPSGTTAKQVVDAWNAMILNFPEENLELLHSLKNQKRTFLLSNTNDIHIQKVHRELQKVSEEKTLHPYFEKVYFSCDIAMRKPDAEIFELVLRENQLTASRTLFIDDSQQHIESAKKLGLQTYFLTKGEKITQLFS